MNFPFYIAKRYLVSKKSHNVINIISWISVLGITIGTAALIIVLSAFNGLQTLVEELYASFDPDIKITLVEGKTFESARFPADEIQALPGVKYYNEAIEEVALIKYDDKQTVTAIKGVKPVFFQMTGMDSLLIEGQFDVSKAESNYLLLGWGIADKLAFYISGDAAYQFSVIVPKRGTKKGLAPDSEFNRKMAYAEGIFSVNPDFDTKYVVSSLEFVQGLLKHEGQLSSVELGLSEDADWDEVKAQLQAIVGDRFKVQTRYELNELIFKTNKTEKWITFLILSFILVIASFNIIGSLTMLIIDKKEDVWTLRTMGASQKMIRKLFFTEGMLINFLGAIIGMSLGALICWMQLQFSLLKLEGGVVEAYPVELQLIDFVYVGIIVTIIGLLASWYPVRVLTKKHL
ncbi:MAG: ABC transporter permease [Flavobacteriales bacterium]|nr:ABC transporter permease [Flavobacteriales bacterium]